MTGILVRAAAPSELPAAASALADAFADDPSFAFIPAGERAMRVRAYMGEAVTHGWLVEVALDGDRVLGAGLWEPPGRPTPSVAETARHALGMIRALGPHWPAAARIDRALARHRPPVPHWFLGYLGVSAAAQGRGVGRALLEHRLAAIDAPVYLEAATDRAAALYRRLGFVDLGRFSGRHMPAVGMWRPAP
ncbi:GNAT family N-acetyltransferase [Tessaracoccus sp. G1721]